METCAVDIFALALIGLSKVIREQVQKEVRRDRP